MKNDSLVKRSRVAIVYPYLAHYREPVVRLLCQQIPPNPEYTFFTGQKTDQRALKTIDPSKKDTPIEQGGLRWKLVRNFWFRRVFLWQSGVLGLAMSRKYDTIIYLGVMYYFSTWLSAIIARLRGKRVLMWSHGFYGNEGKIKSFIRTAFYKLANGMLLYGNWSREIMLKKGFAPDDLYVVFNSLDYETQKKMRKETSEDQIDKFKNKLFAEPDLPVLFFAGRLVANKRLEMLFKAADLLANRGVAVNILLIGDGPEQERLKSVCNKLNLQNRTCFYGSCYEETRLAKLMMMSDLCVSPEGVGLTAMHSLAYGIPVITHDDPVHQKPEYEAIVKGQSGEFFKRSSVEDLAKTIESWLAKKRTKTENAAKCIEIIERRYNPATQVKIFNAAVSGEPAEQVFSQMREDDRMAEN